MSAPKTLTQRIALLNLAALALAKAAESGQLWRTNRAERKLRYQAKRYASLFKRRYR